MAKKAGLARAARLVAELRDLCDEDRAIAKFVDDALWEDYDDDGEPGRKKRLSEREEEMTESDWDNMMRAMGV